MSNQPAAAALEADIMAGLVDKKQSQEETKTKVVE